MNHETIKKSEQVLALLEARRVVQNEMVRLGRGVCGFHTIRELEHTVEVLEKLIEEIEPGAL